MCCRNVLTHRLLRGQLRKPMGEAMESVSRRGFIGAGAIAAASLAFAGCSTHKGLSSSAAVSQGSSKNASASAATGASETGELRFVTGSETGTYYAVGSVIASYVSEHAGLNVTSSPSGGSRANLLEVENDTAQFGFCQSDVMAYAYDGTYLFEGEPMVSFSTVASLYDEQVQIVTCDPSFKSVQDLKGKRVSIGEANSGVYFNAVDILAAYGMTESDISAEFKSFSDSADDLVSGEIDAAFIVAGAPTAAITALAGKKGVYLIPLDDLAIAELLDASPYYVESKIEAGTYAGQAEDVKTVAVSAVIVVSDFVDEETVRAFTACIFDNLVDLEKYDAKFAEMDVVTAGSVTSVPYHPGAAKYFKSQGVSVLVK